MTTKENKNIFLNFQQSNKTNPTSLFSSLTPTNDNYLQRQNKSSISSKRENFHNEIRKKQKEQIKKNMRSQFMKALRNNTLFSQLQQMATKNSTLSQNLSQFFSQLKKTINDYDFFKKLQQNHSVKQYLVDLYVSITQLQKINQKVLLIQCLISLTYYGLSTLEQNQKQKLIDAMVVELQKVKYWNFEQMDYFYNLLNLLKNMSADRDQNFDYYLIDTKIFCIIAEKITEILDQAQKNSHQSQDKEIQQKYIDQLTDIRESFLGTLFNLSQYQNEFFFKFTINELVNDRNYIDSFPIHVVRIFCNFFHHQKFRQDFFDNQDLFGWFESYIPSICQKKSINFKDTGNNQNLILSQNQKQLFYQFISCLMIFIQNQTQEVSIQTNTLVEENINLYFLSEFLIQAAGQGDQIYKTRRNSVYVSKAIKIYQYLASNPMRSAQRLLKVTSERTFQDIIKVFLDKTYFTSYKISYFTLSFLNKIISKDNQMLKTFMELRILDSIDAFLEGNIQIQTKQQIINFLELLTLMIITQDQISKKNRKYNEIIRLFEMKGFIQKIQRYQQHRQRQVSDKVQAFLSYIDTYREGNFRQELVLEI